MLESFLSKPTQGYFVKFVETAPLVDQNHIFCGSHDIPGAICPNCEKTLLRFLTLNCKDQRLDLNECLVENVHLLFCWTCNIAQEPFFYEINEQGVCLLKYEKGGAGENPPYDNYPIFFPEQKIRLSPISHEEQQALISLNEVDSDKWHVLIDQKALDLIKNKEFHFPKHQIGGIPFIAQWDRNLSCPVCANPMPFLAEIGNDAGGGDEFTGNCGIQIIYKFCRTCSTVACYHDCD
jgi:hypothetical protein